MATDKGVIQGYTGVAAVDAKHQIIVDAQAQGTGSEQELLLPVVEALATLRTSTTVLTADAGYHSEANLAALAALAVPALIADPDMRKRDERFADREIRPSSSRGGSFGIGARLGRPRGCAARGAKVVTFGANKGSAKRGTAISARSRLDSRGAGCGTNRKAPSVAGIGTDSRTADRACAGSGSSRARASC